MQAAFAAAVSAVAYYLGIVAVLIVVLLIAMIIDYVTGMISAWYKAELSSKKGVSVSSKRSAIYGLCVSGWVLTGSFTAAFTRSWLILGTSYFSGCR